MKSPAFGLAAVLAAASSALSFPLGPLPYQRYLYRELDYGRERGRYTAEPTRRTKGRLGAAKRLADRQAWNAGKR